MLHSKLPHPLTKIAAGARTRLRSTLSRHVILLLGIIFGFSFSTRPSLKELFPSYWLIIQCAYLAHAYRRKSLNRQLLAFIGKLQFQTILKIVTHFGAVFLLAVIFDFCLGNPVLPDRPSPPLTVSDIILLRTLNFLRFALAASVVISYWRYHQLRRAGYDISEIANGSYCERTFLIPAAVPSVEAGLALRLQQLQFDKAPRFTRMFFDTLPKVRQASGSSASLELSWAFCPTSINLSVRKAEGGSVVRMKGQLRRGLYRFEVFAAPREVTALLNFLKTNLVDATDNEMKLSNALRKQDEFRHLAVEAQLRMLQTQIEPHFLFNTLANVQQMYRENLDQGEEMLSHLTAYFRGAVEGFRSERSTIEKEMDLSSRYLAIMQARMGGRLTFTFIAEEGLKHHPIPPAMLISLVENSIKHGIAPGVGGTVDVQATRAGEVVRLHVVDDGAGFSSVGGTGTGLSNLRQRLDALYGNRAWLEIEAGVDGGFKATIVLPFEE